MPKYKCIKPFLYTKKDGGAVSVRLYEAGSIVDFDGIPSSNLEPLDAEGRKAREAAEELFAEQRRDAALKAANIGGAVSAEAMLGRLAEMMGEMMAAAQERKAKVGSKAA